MKQHLRRAFWSVWDGPVGTVVMWIIALVGFGILGSGLFNAFRLTFGTLLGVGVGWRIRRRIDAGVRQRNGATRIAHAIAGLRRFLRGEEEEENRL